jgi:hypothetical protein
MMLITWAKYSACGNSKSTESIWFLLVVRTLLNGLFPNLVSSLAQILGMQSILKIIYGVVGLLKFRWGFGLVFCLVGDSLYV